jgi:hypothetical protein
MAGGPPDAVATSAPLRSAVSMCGTTRWSAAAVQAPPFETMCDGLDASGGYVICRMV